MGCLSLTLRHLIALDLGIFAPGSAAGGVEAVPPVYTAMFTGEVRLPGGRHILYNGPTDVIDMLSSERVVDPVSE